MKNTILFFKFSLIVSILSLFLIACQKNEPDSNTPSENPDTDSVASLDTISNHFNFLGANEINGNLPVGVARIVDLKFNIKDTLRLVPGTYIPVKFLHDTNTHVTGVFIQVVGVKGGSLGASDYFDVPELPDLDEDSVSIVIVGFDPPSGSVPFDFPISFNIKIEPHDDDGQPLDEITIPVHVDELDDDPDNSICGLTGGYWKWDYSYILPLAGSSDLFFENSPDKIWGRTGQIIWGSCCAGISIYGMCPGEREPNAALHFSTYSQYAEEDLTFYENGTFFRQTIHKTATPFPEESDFCSNAGGVVKEHISSVSYQGNWTVENISVPERFKNWYDERNLLSLNQTSSTDLGYGNPGGLIHQLTCDFLMLIQLDPEGFGQDLFKLYIRKNNYQSNDEDDWYDIPEE